MSTTPTTINDSTPPNTRYSRRKRRLEPEQNDSDQTPKNKKNKTRKMSTADTNQLMLFITDMKNEIEKQISSSQTSIETKITDLATTVNTEVQELKVSVDDLNTKVSSEIESLKQHVTEHNQRLDNNDDDINRLKLSADLRMNGIPFVQGENLAELFQKIAATIGYDSSNNSNVPLIKRIPVRDKVSGNMIDSSIISFHFSSIQHKQFFYSLYLNKMPLKPESLGLSKNIKIVIGESLTRINANIFKYAQNLKKDGKIAQTFTADGLVKVKFIKGPKQRAHTIRNTVQLEILVKENEQKTQQKNQQQNQATNSMEIEEPTSAHQLNVNGMLNSSIEMITVNRNAAEATSHSQQQHQQIQQQLHPTPAATNNTAHSLNTS